MSPPRPGLLRLVADAYRFAGVPDPWVMAARYVARLGNGPPGTARAAPAEAALGTSSPPPDGQSLSAASLSGDDDGPAVSP